MFFLVALMLGSGPLLRAETTKRVAPVSIDEKNIVFDGFVCFLLAKLPTFAPFLLAIFVDSGLFVFVILYFSKKF